MRSYRVIVNDKKKTFNVFDVEKETMLRRQEHFNIFWMNEEAHVITFEGTSDTGKYRTSVVFDFVEIALGDGV